MSVVPCCAGVSAVLWIVLLLVLWLVLCCAVLSCAGLSLGLCTRIEFMHGFLCEQGRTCNFQRLLLGRACVLVGPWPFPPCVTGPAAGLLEPAGLQSCQCLLQALLGPRAAST
jgi:hypothetical protein